MLPILTEVLGYEPDLIIVATGHNEFLEDRAYPPLIHSSLTAKRVWIWLNGLRTYSLGRHLIKDLRAPGGEDAPPGA
ncbi:MAG: hypothetical protein IH987_14380, partial [Planctomycetes bacterium]|nr:hypothetical protein [Planctomycetota bacterium]